MKFYSLSKLDFFKTISQIKLLMKYSTESAVVESEPSETLSIQNKEKNKVFAPALTNDALQALNDITGVTIATSNVSWAKISVPNFTLLEWNSYTLPSKFRSDMDDANILALANVISQKIPDSNMYVVENCSFKSLVFKEHILRTAIMVLLNCRDKDINFPSKVIFQKPVILNSLCRILVGTERTSASRIVKNIFQLSGSRKDKPIGDERFPEIFSLLSVYEKQKQNFLCYDLAKQESLSLALLIILTFSELNIIQNQESINIIQSRRQMKPKKTSTKTKKS